LYQIKKTWYTSRLFLEKWEIFFKNKYQ